MHKEMSQRERQVRRVDAASFQQAFAPFPDPVFFYAGGTWFNNPAAGQLGLTPVEVDSLLDLADQEAPSVWLHEKYYAVTPCKLEGSIYFILRQDRFLTTSGNDLAGQLRSTLSSSLIALQTVANKMDKETYARSRASLGSLNKRLYQLLNLAEQLDMVASPSNRFYHPEHIELPNFLASFQRLCAEFCAQLHVTLRVNIPYPILSVTADKEKLYYLMMVLFSDTVQSLPPEGGEVLISVRCVQGDHVRVTFSSQAAAPPLEEPAQPSRLSALQTPGLSIPLIERIVSAHGGSVLMEHSASGPLFHLSLPLGEKILTFHSPRYVPPPEVMPDRTRCLMVFSDVLPDETYVPQPLLPSNRK